MNIQEFKTDLEAERDGKWFEFDGSRFLIAASMNPTHRKTTQRLGRTKYSAAVRKSDPAGLQALANESIAESVLLDWENVRDGEKEFPYTKENALALLTQSRVFRDWVESQAMDLSQFVKTTEDAAIAAAKSGSPVAPDVG